MVIEVLVCRPDGSQVLEQKEVLGDWFGEATPELEPPEPTIEEQVKLLSAQLKAAQESNAFLEDCLVEMAEIIYA